MPKVQTFIGFRVPKDKLPLVRDAEKIAARDFAGNLSELARKAFEEYVRGHAEGNEAFSLDKWLGDPAFVALPALSSKLTLEQFDAMDEETREQIRKNATRLISEVDAADRRAQTRAKSHTVRQ